GRRFGERGGASPPARVSTPAALWGRPPLRVAWQPVVRQLLPRSRVRDELMVARADAGILVEGAQAHRHHFRVIRAAAPQRRAARRAELLRKAVGRTVRSDELLSGRDPQ